MKILSTLIISVFCFFSSQLLSQIRTPAPSPSAKVEQMVGLTTISVEYSRPGVKGRTIFATDGLVPFGKIWRTGANAATKISFSDDVTIEGKELKKGKYAILTVPGAKSWKVNFYTFDKSGFGGYVEKEPNVSVDVPAVTMHGESQISNFMIVFDEITNSSANLSFLWENTYVPVKIGVNSEEAVLKNIERVLSGPSANDYYAAGLYYYQNGKDKAQALEWIQKATHSAEPRFWQLRWEAEVLASMGKTKEAISVAKKSMELAEKAENQDYIRINEKNINKWKSM